MNDLNKKIKLLFDKGILVTNPSGLQTLALQRDPFLTKRFLSERENQGKKFLELLLYDQFPCSIVVDPLVASELMFISPQIHVGPGFLKKHLFAGIAPQYVSAKVGFNWAKLHAFHEEFLHSPILFTFFQDKLNHLFQEFGFNHEQWDSLASELTFGNQKNDFLLKMVQKAQTQEVVFSTHRIPLEQTNSWKKLLQQVHQIEQCPWLHNNSMVGISLSFAKKYGLNSSLVANQCVLWMLELNNIFTLLLPICLTLIILWQREKGPISDAKTFRGFISETLRLYGHIFMLERQVYGHQVLIPLHLFNHDPTIWDHPNSFDPLRQPQCSKELTPSSFGLGAQKCPAQHLALFLLEFSCQWYMSHYILFTSVQKIDFQNMPPLLNSFVLRKALWGIEIKML